MNYLIIYLIGFIASYVVIKLTFHKPYFFINEASVLICCLLSWLIFIPLIITYISTNTKPPKLL